MTPLKLQVELLRAEFASTPDPVARTSGHKCPDCGAYYAVMFGRHSKKWFAMHTLNPHCADHGQFICTNAETREQALEVCREYAEGEKSL